ncbi:type II toxin-antitoxin system prevent-host-death family antitoxin [Candidatus Poriferisodalis sp.]|uniref:type II toxin-antitoxin system prevent-host-death family antitoxin n=1 Tax=Candidatus Poriferisodalis sp. TaxID=3101277 RepID=UPI003B51A640
MTNVIPEWQLQDAKNRFSAVVDAALLGEPQRVTRRGQPVVVVVAVDEFERLCRLDSTTAPTFGELLASIPQDDDEFERLHLSARDVAF